MDFKHLPIQSQPVYTWLWNTTITKEGIRRRIDEMYECGIRAFYVLAEPENFRPTLRPTHLKPAYLSDEYLDLLYEAFEYATSKGMYTWLYNEGGFPSGNACGKIREAHPELAFQGMATRPIILHVGEIYHPTEGTMASFVHEDTRVYEGFSSDQEVEIREYFATYSCCERGIIRSDIAQRRTTEAFLELTHERLKARFGDHMGESVHLMFDDEAHIGSWTQDLDQIFTEKYGYDMRDYFPYIFRRSRVDCDTDLKRRALSDCRMLCGELLRNNYFHPMREWLNTHGMLSTGHLDGEDTAVHSYGNLLSILREYDVPGVDVIWGQISFPKDGVCTPKSYPFFPRVASSAARQQGHDRSVSECFAVYGAQLTHEEMRFIVNYQAVRGISQYNFMVISYDKDTPMAHQYRPNFLIENPGMDCLENLNTYTARLSHILQSGRSVVRTALYFPQRSVYDLEQAGQAAQTSYVELGNMLERAGVSFDIIDEEFVQGATVKDGVLCGEHACYESVFLPEGELEPTDVIDKLRKVKATVLPDIIRGKETTLTRHIRFDDGEGYFVFNQSNETVEDKLEILTDKIPYVVNLMDGSLSELVFYRHDGMVCLPLRMIRGEGVMIYLADAPKEAQKPTALTVCATLTQWSSFVSRRYTLSVEDGIVNTHYTEGKDLGGLGEWSGDFSGDVTYTTTLPSLPNAPLTLDLGEVRHYAKVYLNGCKIGEVTMPPYHIRLPQTQSGDHLTVVVSNTPANVCASTDYFDRSDAAHVGPYHATMKVSEALAPAGGWLGPVRILIDLSDAESMSAL